VSALRSMQPATKAERQRAILDLVRGGAIRTQDDLVAGLRRRRMDVTQATVSRDIRELGLLRVHGDDGARYRIPLAEIDTAGSERRLKAALHEYATALEFIDLLGVVHTTPGGAQLVAAAIDGARFDEVAGTVAGDDTVLVVTRSRPAGQRLVLRLRGMIGDSL